MDANVWFALVATKHEHHERVLGWFDQLAEGEAALCRVVQLAVVRLMGDTRIAGKNAVPAFEAWKAIESLTTDERVEFVVEPSGLSSTILPLFRYRVPTPKLVIDAYLAAFAIASEKRLTTLDRGFREFAGLDVELL